MINLSVSIFSAHVASKATFLNGSVKTGNDEYQKVDCVVFDNDKTHESLTNATTGLIDQLEARESDSTPIVVNVEGRLAKSDTPGINDETKLPFPPKVKLIVDHLSPAYFD